MNGKYDGPKRVRVLHLSRPFGHQMAITAGLDHATGDAVVMLDGDLQDPPELIAEMVEKWAGGADVVYAVRKQRAGETRMKLTTARYFTPAGRSIQAKGIEPDVLIDDGRDSPNRIREANLEHHLDVPGAPGATNATTAAGKGAATTAPDVKTAPKTGGQPDALPPRLDFGSDEDFTLKQAINHLKGAPVIESVKSLSAQAKTQ